MRFFRRRDLAALALIALVWAAAIAYRAAYLEPRIWGALCTAPNAPLTCVPRAGLIWLQHFYILGAASLACGLAAFFFRAPFVLAIAAILIGIVAVENYNATWGMLGAALGAWAWLRPPARAIAEARSRVR